MAFYQVDVLEEEVIKQWGTHVSKKYVDKETSKRVRKASEPFLKVRTFLHLPLCEEADRWRNILIHSGSTRRRSPGKSLMTSEGLAFAVYPICFRIWTGRFAVMKSSAPASFDPSTYGSCIRDCSASIWYVRAACHGLYSYLSVSWTSHTFCPLRCLE